MAMMTSRSHIGCGRSSSGRVVMLAYAKAIYDNEAESSDELSFDRDDVMTVLEKDFGGMEGWWFCSFQGKTGIAPANRLQIIREIKEPMSAKNVKAFPVRVDVPTVRGQMDYDLPKPNIPRKLGGSCENLLSIDSPPDRHGTDYNPGEKVLPGVRKGRRFGGSCDNLLLNLSTDDLSSSNASSGVDLSREYDVPVSLSLSPEDFYGSEISPKRKLDCHRLTSGKTKPDVSAGGANGRRKQSSESDSEERRRFFGHPKTTNVATNQSKTFNQTDIRDSALADYDIPKTGTHSTSRKIKIAKDSSGIESAKKSISDHKTSPTAVPSNTGSSSPTSCKIRPLIDDRAFLEKVHEVQNAVDQVLKFSDKWAACKNPETRRSIVKQVCLSIWNKLQELLVDFSKLLVKINSPGPLKDRFGALKVSAGTLEEVLTNLSRCRPNEVTLDFVKELNVTAQDIRDHVDYCTSILSGDIGDLFKSSRRPQPQTDPHNISWTGRGAGLPQRRDPPAPPRNPENTPRKIDSLETNPTRTTPIHTIYPKISPPFVRTLSHNHDYDVPKSNRLDVAKSRDLQTEGRDLQTEGRGLQTEGRNLERSPGVRRAQRPSSSDNAKKRSAVVLGDHQNSSFSILERRNLNLPVTYSKLIVGKVSPTIPEASPSRLTSLGSVDYDFPNPNAGKTRAKPDVTSNVENVASRDVIAARLNVTDQRLVEFYTEEMVSGLGQLDAICRLFREENSSPFNRQVASSHLARLQAVVVGTRKIVFVCDTLVKNLNNATMKRKLDELSSALVAVTKAICQQQPASSSSQKLFLQRLVELMAIVRDLGNLFSLGQSSRTFAAWN